MSTNAAIAPQGPTADERAAALSAAREELDRTAGNVVAAAEAFAARVRATPALYAALLDPLLDQACYQMLAQLNISARKRVWRPPAGDPHQRGRLVNLSRSLLDFPLPGGKRLTEATRGDLLSGSKFYAKLATDQGHKARWLSLVAKGVKRDQTVGQVYDEASLRRLQTKSQSDD